MLLSITIMAQMRIRTLIYFNGGLHVGPYSSPAIIQVLVSYYNLLIIMYIPSSLSRLLFIQVPALFQDYSLFKYQLSVKTTPYSSTSSLSRLLLIQIPALFQDYSLFKYKLSFKTYPYSSTSLSCHYGMTHNSNITFSQALT